MTTDPATPLPKPQTSPAELVHARASEREAFYARGRAALEEMERTGISFTVDDVSEYLARKLMAKRAELLRSEGS